MKILPLSPIAKMVAILLAMSFSFANSKAQQLYCGSTSLTGCTGAIGVGAPNVPILGLTFGLYVTHNTSSGGGLLVANPSTATSAIGIWTSSTNGVGLTSLSTTGTAVRGETVSGFGVYGKATNSSGLAGYFDGTTHIENGTLTVKSASTNTAGVAHFKAGASRQLFVVANLTNGGFNHLSQAGDFGLLFSDGAASGGKNQDAGLVLAPWTAASKGIRINKDGKVGIGVAQPQVALDVLGNVQVDGDILLAEDANIDGDIILQGDALIDGSLEVGGVLTPTAVLHLRGDFKLQNIQTGDNEFEVNDDGEVTCRKVSVNEGLIADYVFASDYDLLPLTELESFINVHHHLPGIKSEAEYQAIGSIDLGELQLKSLEKIEELTLYVIELQKKIVELEKQVDALTNDQK